LCKSFFAFNETIVIYLLTLINKFKKMPTPKKMVKSTGTPQSRTDKKVQKKGSFSTSEGTYTKTGKKIAGPYGSALPKEEKKTRTYYDVTKKSESSYKPGLNKDLRAVKKSNKAAVSGKTMFGKK
jgi:hypothetical protein